MDRPTPARAALSFSEPGAPPEPQRTIVRIGITRDEHAVLLRAASTAGFLGQEALEPRFGSVAPHRAIPDLVTGALDIAVVDLATLLGEHTLGWDGLAVAAFGPAGDRSVGVAVVERATWRDRRDLCERLARACARAHQRVAFEPGSVVGEWWASCRPSTEEIDAVARWADESVTRELPTVLSWAVASD